MRTDPSAETQRPSPPRLCSAAPRGPKMAAAPPPACCPPAALALHAALPRLLAQLPRPPLSLRSALSPHRPEPSAPLRTAPHHDGSADPACSRLPPPLPNRKRKFAYRRRRYQHCSITPRCAAPRPPSPPGFPLPSRVASATHTALCSSAPLLSSAPLRSSPLLPSAPPSRPVAPPPSPALRDSFLAEGFGVTCHSVTKIKFFKRAYFILLLLFFFFLQERVRRE